MIFKDVNCLEMVLKNILTLMIFQCYINPRIFIYTRAKWKFGRIKAGFFSHTEARHSESYGRARAVAQA